MPVYPTELERVQAHAESTNTLKAFRQRYAEFNAAARFGDWKKAATILDEERALRAVAR